MSYVPGAEWTAAFSKRSSRSYEYWAYQIPVVGRVATMRDNARYWDDYYKNTGFRPRYPGRQYGNNGFGATYSQAKMLYGSAKKIYG